MPHVLVLMATMPAAVETSVNCWATDTDEKIPTNPAAVARHKDAFFRPNGTRHNFRRPQNVGLINDVNSGVFISGHFYEGSE